MSTPTHATVSPVEIIIHGTESAALRLPSGSVIGGVYTGAECDPFTPEEARAVAQAVNSFPALLSEAQADLQWIENLLCDINAGRPLRPERISEGLTLRVAALRRVIAQAEGRTQ